MEYRVLAIIKNNKGETLGVRVSYKSDIEDISRLKLMELYNKGIKFSNAILYADGTVRAKKGNLPIIIIGTEKVSRNVADLSKQRNNIVELDRVIKVYHGAKESINGNIDVNYSNLPCDFGHCFYTSKNLMQARNRVCNFSKSRLYTFEIDLSGYKAYRFKDDILWALYIARNRNKLLRSLLKKYKKLNDIFKFIDSQDVIIGLIADDKMADSYSEFLRGNITDKALTECLKCVDYGTQIAIKNQKICDDRLTILSDDKLTEDEKREAKIWGNKKKRYISNKVEKLKKEYRYEGRYIEDILKEYE